MYAQDGIGGRDRHEGIGDNRPDPLREGDQLVRRHRLSESAHEWTPARHGEDRWG